MIAGIMTMTPFFITKQFNIMKLQIRKEIVKEIEIEFPYFTKNICANFAFLSENVCIHVQRGYKLESWHIQRHNFCPEVWLLEEQSTAAEFMAAKKEVESLIKSINFYKEQRAAKAETVYVGEGFTTHFKNAPQAPPVSESEVPFLKIEPSSEG